MASPNQLEMDSELNSEFIAWKEQCENTIDSLMQEAPIPIQGAILKYWIGATVPVTKKLNSTANVDSTTNEIVHSLHMEEDNSTKKSKTNKTCYR